MWWKRPGEYLLILLSAFLTAWILREDAYSPWLASLLALNILLAILVRKNASVLLKIVSRVFLGLVFTLSGYVKLVDPMGSMYKFEDYFYALDLEKLVPYSLEFSALLTLAEFLIGVALLFRLRMRITSWVLTAFMLFFLPVTLWLAITNAVPDCGCFGDFFILSNTQTFFKNLLFLAPVIIILSNRRYYGWRMRPMYHWVSLGLVAASALFVMNSSYRHLPLHDFRPWKVGSTIVAPKVPDIYLVYQDTKTGEQKEWLTADLPWQDSTWLADWEYVDTRTVYYSEEHSNYFALEDETKVDHGREVLLNPSYQLLVVIYDVLKAPPGIIEELNTMYDEAEKAGVSMAGASGSLFEAIEPFVFVRKVRYPVYSTDDITLKAVIRSSPGLLLLHNGTVLAKWHSGDFPTFDKIREKYMSN